MITVKIKIESEKDNPYLKRKELDIIIEHPAAPTPQLSAVQQFLAKTLKKDVQQVEVKNIFSFSGASKSESKIFVWEEKKVPDLSKVVKEKKTKEEAKPVKEEKKAEKKEEKAETKKEEKPAEEPEPKKEEKKEESAQSPNSKEEKK